MQSVRIIRQHDVTHDNGSASLAVLEMPAQGGFMAEVLYVDASRPHNPVIRRFLFEHSAAVLPYAERWISENLGGNVEIAEAQAVFDRIESIEE